MGHDAGMTIVDAPRNTYLEGNYAPVASEVTATDLRVLGTIPEALNGRLLRNGPNPFGPQDPATYHWFTGNGMVHGLALRDGRAEWFRSRAVRSDATMEALGHGPVGEAQGPMSGNGPNTNVIGLNGRTFALVEAGTYPTELDYELNTIGPNNFNGTLDGAFSAHPKRDPLTGEMHAMTYFYGWGNQVRYVVLNADGLVTKEIPIDVSGPIMLHDIGLSAKYAVVMDMPCHFNMDAAMTGAGLPYRWNPDGATRFGLLARDGDSSSVVWCDVDPCYIFHPMNTYDLPDGRVVMDAVKHPRMFATRLLGPDEGKPIMVRFTMDPTTGRATEEIVDEHGQEFPRHDERLVGLPYQWGYGAHIGPHFEYGGLLKFDMHTGAVAEKSLGAHIGMQEAVFVPRHAKAAEDDGWLMAYAHNAQRDAAEVFILDAQDFSAPPVAVVELPTRVPYGFHGNWVAN